MDDVFKALADTTRRALLDSLREKDGQTLTELEGGLGMTRFGVMKHLKILEAANLVSTRKAGRFKHHYLNAVPLQAALDRWVEPFRVKPLAQQILDIKELAEGAENMTEDAKPDFVLATYINASPQAVWDALTQAEHVNRYQFLGGSMPPEADQPGRLDQLYPDGSPMLGMEILFQEPTRVLECSFEPRWPGPSGELPASRCRYEIEEVDGASKLTVLHFGLTPGLEGVADGWAKTLASLKSYLETGQGMRFPLNAA
ncbi:MAG: metalloregulator ArsR/SmtB family transcription factor [Pseudomonadota bacterium]